MRRVNGYQLLALILACLGAAAWMHSVDFASFTSRCGAIALWLTAAGSSVMAMRSARKDRTRLVRQMRQAAASVRPTDSRYAAPSIDADAFGAAVDGLVAAARAQVLTLEHRTAELELRLKAVAIERDDSATVLTRVADEVGALQSTVARRDAAPASRPEAAQFSESRGLVALSSHELRTPLASIRAYAEMLVDGEADDDRARQEFYVVIQTEAERLSQAVENVLTLASIQSGMRVPDRRPARLRFLLARAVEQVKPLAATREVEISIESNAACDLVLADEQLIQRAIANLLTHEIRVREKGATLRVTLTTNDGGDRARVQVLQEIPEPEPKHPPLALDRTYGGNVSATDDPGLQLVRYVVEPVHGGRMLGLAGGREPLGMELMLDRREAAVERA